jgi:hypothetical protein
MPNVIPAAAMTARFLLRGVLALSGMAIACNAGSAPGPEEVYVGYYQEDPLNNPEDPTMGSVYVKLPSADGGFAGNMFFTYVGCQTSNVGSITGAKTALHLQGAWTGTLDGTAQQGSFEGDRTAQRDIFRGKYTVAGGKQHITVGNCIQYYVAAYGTFELFAVGSSDPGDFSVSVQGQAISWRSSSGAMMTLVSVMDPVLARDGQRNATVWQTLLVGPRATVDVSHIGLIPGHQYVASVGIADSNFKRVSFGSTTFTAASALQH